MARIDGIKLKIERAKQHVRDVDIAIRGFCESKPYTIGSKPHPVTAIEHITLYVESVQPVPENIVLITGDAIHNLRSALDHLSWQLVEANGQMPDRNTYFPISDCAKQYATTVSKGVVAKIAVRAQKLVGNVQSHITGSIKGDVKKKTFPSTGDRKEFCLDLQPTDSNCVSRAIERFCSGRCSRSFGFIG